MIVFIFYTAKAEEIIFFSLHTFRRYIKKLLKLSFSSFLWQQIFLFIGGTIYQNAQNVPVSNPNQQQFGLSPSSCFFNICLIIFRIWHVFFLFLLYSVNMKNRKERIRWWKHLSVIFIKSWIFMLVSIVVIIAHRTQCKCQ